MFLILWLVGRSCLHYQWLSHHIFLTSCRGWSSQSISIMLCLILTLIGFAVTNGEKCYDLSHGCSAETMLAVHTNVLDAHTCQQRCQETSECSNFTWHTPDSPTVGHLCTLHTSCEITPCEHCLSGPASCTCSSSGACRPDNGGTNILSAVAGVQTEDECGAVCTDTTSCESYTWYNIDHPLLGGTCMLFSSCSQLDTSCTSCVSGHLNCLPACNTLPTVSNGEWICSGPQGDSNSCHLECDPGFVASNQTFTSCNTGAWSPDIESMNCEEAVLLLTGGLFPAGNTAEVYSFEPSCSQEIETLPDEIMGHSLNLVDGQILSCGCNNNENCQNICQVIPCITNMLTNMHHRCTTRMLQHGPPI